MAARWIFRAFGILALAVSISVFPRSIPMGLGLLLAGFVLLALSGKSRFRLVKTRLENASLCNEDGTSRQEILRKIKMKEAPFQGNYMVNVVRGERDAAPELGVYVNGIQIGSIQRDLAQEILDHMDSFQCVTRFKVIASDAGGADPEYGAEMVFRFLNR